MNTARTKPALHIAHTLTDIDERHEHDGAPLRPIAGQLVRHRQIVVAGLLDAALAVLVHLGHRYNVAGQIEADRMADQRLSVQPVAVVAVAVAKDGRVADLGAEHDQEQRADGREQHVQHKVAMIGVADAVVQPGCFRSVRISVWYKQWEPTKQKTPTTMVVHLEHASAAHRTVMRARRLRSDALLADAGRLRD